MPEQKLTWEQKIRYEINALIYAHSSGTEITAEEKEGIIMAIKEGIKPELEKAFNQGCEYGAEDYISDLSNTYKMKTADFETWYQNTYFKHQQ